MDAQFDMLLRGGRVIDPATGRDGVADIAIRDNLIARSSRLFRRRGASGCLMSARSSRRLIDTHAHVYEHVTGRFGLNADMVGVRSGVTHWWIRAALVA